MADLATLKFGFPPGAGQIGLSPSETCDLKLFRKCDTILRHLIRQFPKNSKLTNGGKRDGHETFSIYWKKT
jgi:hypothetical protein